MAFQHQFSELDNFEIVRLGAVHVDQETKCIHLSLIYSFKKVIQLSNHFSCTNVYLAESCQPTKSASVILSCKCQECQYSFNLTGIGFSPGTIIVR